MTWSLVTWGSNFYTRCLIQLLTDSGRRFFRGGHFLPPPPPPVRVLSHPTALSTAKETLEGLSGRVLKSFGPFAQGPQVVWRGYGPMCPLVCVLGFKGPSLGSKSEMAHSKLFEKAPLNWRGSMYVLVGPCNFKAEWARGAPLVSRESPKSESKYCFFCELRNFSTLSERNQLTSWFWGGVTLDSSEDCLPSPSPLPPKRKSWDRLCRVSPVRFT